MNESEILITMLSSTDLERLITVKRREIEKEKTLLGLISPDRSLKVSTHCIMALVAHYSV